MKYVKSTVMGLVVLALAGGTFGEENDSDAVAIEAMDGTRQTAVLSALGAAIAPAIGAFIGPLLTNIATGITASITTTIANGFTSTNTNLPRFEAQIVESADTRVPYVVVTTSLPQAEAPAPAPAPELAVRNPPHQLHPLKTAPENKYAMSIADALFPGLVSKHQRTAH